MLRHKPSSLARLCSTLINPGPGNSPNWTSNRLANRPIGTSFELDNSLHHSIFAPFLQTLYTPAFFSQLLLRDQLQSVRYSSNGTIINSNDKNTTSNKKGEGCYKLATEALQNASRAKRKREERLLQEQYDAMDAQRKRTQQRERQRQNEKWRNPRPQRLSDAEGTTGRESVKDRAAGVAVVRTIVKQSQPKNDRVERSHDSGQSGTTSPGAASNAKASERKDSEEHWQQVAIKHMEEAAFRHGHGSALVRLGNEALERARDDSGSTSSRGSLINRGRCKEWTDESPINLATVLDLSDIGVDKGSDEQADAGIGKDEPIPPYLRLALHLYEEGGKQGSAEGWYNLGHLLWDGVFGAHVDYSTKEKAMDAFHNAMELGDADAMYFVASHYLSYEEKEEDYCDALLLSNTYKHYGPAFLTLLQSACSGSHTRTEQPSISSITDELQQHGYKLLHLAADHHNHGPALHHLALLHLQNDDIEEFRRALSKAAVTGHPHSLFLRGHCCYSGTDGYDRDYRAALEDFLEAADNGHVDAMVSAGALLHQGVALEDGRLIIERDQRRAFALYQQAGELGSTEGWRNVVSCYATGQGVPRCLETAKYIANTMLKDDDN